MLGCLVEIESHEGENQTMNEYYLISFIKIMSRFLFVVIYKDYNRLYQLFYNICLAIKNYFLQILYPLVYKSFAYTEHIHIILMCNFITSY